MSDPTQFWSLVNRKRVQAYPRSSTLNGYNGWAIYVTFGVNSDDPTAPYLPQPTSASPFPAFVEMDYLRVYRAPPPAVVTALSTRNMMMGGDDGSYAPDANLTYRSYVEHVAMQAGTQIALHYDDACIRGTSVGSETPTYVSATLKGVVQIGGAQYPVLWGGASSGAIASGAGLTSDYVTVPAFAAGDVIGIWSEFSQGSTSYNTNYGLRSYRANDRATHYATTPGGALGANTTGWSDYEGIGPTTVLTKAARRPIGFLGDSNMADQSHNADSNGATSFPRALTNRGSVKFAATGISASSQIGNLAIRRAAFVAAGVVDVMVLLGTNDITSDSAATVLANLASVASNLTAVGLVPHFLTLPPYGSYAAKVVAVNAGIRAGIAGAGAYYDFNAAVSVSETAWKSGYDAGDGVHFKWADATARVFVLADFASWLASAGI